MGALTIALGAGAALAADIGVSGKKLIIVDKTTAASRAKVVYVSKDKAAGITKGAGNSVSSVDAVFDFFYANGSAGGAFVVPAGASNGTDGWKVNKPTVAKYVNKPAPAGGGVKVSVIKPSKILKMVGKSLGDSPADIYQAGDTTAAVDVSTIYTVVDGGATRRHCGEFTGCKRKIIGGGSGAKVVCKVATPGGSVTCPASPSSAFLK
jgi:hypothetical protein